MSDQPITDEELLRRWLRGETTRQEEARLEAAARDDEWLAEALSGYQLRVEEDHTARLATLRRRLAPAPAQRLVLPAVWRRSAVAIALLLVVSVTMTVWWWQNDRGLMTEAMVVAPEDAAADLSMESLDSAPLPQDTPAMSGPLAQHTPTTAAPPSAPPSPVANQSVRLETEAAGAASAPVNEERLEESSYSLQPSSPGLESDSAADPVTIFSRRRQALSTPPPPPPPAPYAAAAAPVRARILHGQVTNEQGQPLVGAQIKIVGTVQGVRTDSLGLFQLPVDRTVSELLVTHEGYPDEEVQVTKDNEYLQIALAQTATESVSSGNTNGLNNDGRETVYPNKLPTIVAPTLGYTALRRQLRRNKPPQLGSGRVRVRFRLNERGRGEQFVVETSSSAALAAYVIEQLTPIIWSTLQGEPATEVVYSIRFR